MVLSHAVLLKGREHLGLVGLRDLRNPFKDRGQLFLSCMTKIIDG